MPSLSTCTFGLEVLFESVGGVVSTLFSSAAFERGMFGSARMR